MSTGITLLDQIRAGDGNEELVHRLLAEFHRGYPVTELPRLFSSRDVNVVKSAAWIASELGVKGKSILSATAELLSHSSKYVRFFAIDSVLTCATANDGTIIAKVVLLLGDAEESVRWKAMDFLARATRIQIGAALACFQGTREPGNMRKGIELVYEKCPVDERVISFLASEDPVERRFGAVAAARALSRTVKLLECAMTCADEEIRRFAESIPQEKP